MMNFSLRALLVPSACLLGLVTLTSSAWADRLIIKQPGAHPRYGFEAEPHLLLGLLGAPGPSSGDGFGLGFRGSVPIVDNGFVKTINNNVAISFGADWVHYGGDRRRVCNRDTCWYADDYDVESIYLPVAMQWNFFLSENWSVFGEPGLAIRIHWWEYENDWYREDDSDVDLRPVFYVGGRLHFNDSITLTMRLGYPTFSVGVSFLL
jgi:hypothetical protein